MPSGAARTGGHSPPLNLRTYKLSHAVASRNSKRSLSFYAKPARRVNDSALAAREVSPPRPLRLRRSAGHVLGLDGHLAFGRDLVLGLRHAEQPVVEPADDVLQALDAVPGLARARKLVRLAGEAHHHRRNLSELQGAEHLLAAR